MNIPDSIRPFLNEIAQRLWSGRATVMVGAGFSKNADPSFPDWNQLGDLFYEKAHGRKPNDQERKYLNVLRLAEEVKAAIGRSALEQLLRSKIPDRSVQPSALHEALLNLPWNDVFTTNYDTLLERASDRVIDRRYHPVVNNADIPYAEKPRIVKLHGSFPSERPFIISEEDYRRYPVDHAIFVNTVQQSLLESTFCLIGFSGDDPNFLAWIGWIRDNLGYNQTQKIYLIGVFSLTSARTQLLAERGIIVVDLSEVDGIGPHDHGKALEEFFSFLNSRRPDAKDWPKGGTPLSPPGPGTNRGDDWPGVTAAWRKQREDYPGWLILPFTNRKRLWTYTREWLNFLPPLEQATDGTDLQYLFELCWRLEKCLVPLTREIAELCQRTIDKYVPSLPTGGNSSEKPEHDLPGAESWRMIKVPWTALNLHLLRYYRLIGDNRNWKRLQSQLQRVSEELTAGQRELLQYEAYLYNLFNLDPLAVAKTLNMWRPTDSNPFWMSVREAAVAENLSASVSDREAMKKPLMATRRKGIDSDDPQNFVLLSSEAYQIILYRFILAARNIDTDDPPSAAEEDQMKKLFFEMKQSKARHTSFSTAPMSKVVETPSMEGLEAEWQELRTSSVPDQEYRQLLTSVRQNNAVKDQQKEEARLDEIRIQRCDPWNELKLFELALNCDCVPQEGNTVETDFDLDARQAIHRLGLAGAHGIEAYQFLCFIEQIGLPFRVGFSVQGIKAALNSAAQVRESYVHWALITAIRTGNAKAAESILDRAFLSRLSQPAVGRLFRTSLDALNGALMASQDSQYPKSDGLQHRITQIVPEITSRLCCRASFRSRVRLLRFVKDAYAMTSRIRFSGMRNLVIRLLGSFSIVQQARIIPKLLEIQPPGPLPAAFEDDYPNPLLFLEDLKGRGNSEDRARVDPSIIEGFLNSLEASIGEQRRWYISTLIRLHDFEMLNDAQKTRFGRILWSDLDARQLPQNTDFYPFAFLVSPHPSDIDTEKIFKDYIDTKGFPNQTKSPNGSVSIAGGRIEIIRDIIGAQSIRRDFWSQDEVENILQRAIEWWDLDKNLLVSQDAQLGFGFPTAADEIKARFRKLLSLVADVVGPVLRASDGRANGELKRLLQEMAEKGFSTLAAQAACAPLLDSDLETLIHRAKIALGSPDDLVRIDGFRALQHLIMQPPSVSPKPEHAAILQVLTDYLEWCETERSEPALKIIGYALEEGNLALSEKQQTTVASILIKVSKETVFQARKLDTDFVQLLEVRRSAAVLAAILERKLPTKSEDLTTAIWEWKSICLSRAEFSEIRNAWLDNN